MDRSIALDHGSVWWCIRSVGRLVDRPPGSQDSYGRQYLCLLVLAVLGSLQYFASHVYLFSQHNVYRCVCRIIAAITWLAEVFEDKKERERWLGITQAFASVGGVFVTLVSFYIGKYQASLPSFNFPLPAIEGATSPGAWRYVLATGLFPAIPIAILLPFVPESRVWKEKRASGTLKRPSIVELFAPQYLRITLVTALLSACAYGIAFGALQLTPRLIAPGLPELKEAAAELKPLRAEAKTLNEQFDKAATPEEKGAIRKQLGALAAKQKKPDSEVREMGEKVQFFQEMGGLIGRILLAVFVIIGISRVALLKIFQVPALIMLPLTYFMLYHQGGPAFMFAYGVCGLLTVAQFSYFGEYLPKVFPMHLRGTGGSFATNVGGRMVGTSMAVVTSNFLAPMLAGGKPLTPDITAQAAGIVATVIAVIALFGGCSYLSRRPRRSSRKWNSFGQHHLFISRSALAHGFCRTIIQKPDANAFRLITLKHQVIFEVGVVQLAWAN